MSSPRTIRTLMIVDAVLVVVFLVLLVVTLATRPGGEPGAASTATAPTPTATSGTVPADAFRLPSGNIACEMSGEGVTCTIADYTYAAPEVEGCTGPTGHVLTLGPDGVAFACEEDPAPTAAGG